MSICVITGGTTGIGAEARALLQQQGHEVLNIDYKDGDILADLSSKEGRENAIKAVWERYPDGIDILICNAGVGPTAPPQNDFCPELFCLCGSGRRAASSFKEKTR